MFCQMGLGVLSIGGGICIFCQGRWGLSLFGMCLGLYLAQRFGLDLARLETQASNLPNWS